MSVHTYNTVVINAPLDYVWEVTNRVELWPELFAEYASAEVLERTENTVRFRLTMRPDENGNSYSWVSERRLDRDTLSVHARRIEKGPFEFMRIRWEYQEVDGGTQLRWIQWFQVKPEAPLDDEAMAERINHNSRLELDRIKDIVEKKIKIGNLTARS
jgi:aromatase